MSQALKVEITVDDTAANFKVANFDLHVSPCYQSGFRQTVVGIIIIQRREFIFVQSNKDRLKQTWGLPQGGIVFDETIIDALTREIKEELGITLDSTELLSARALGTFLNHLPEERKMKNQEKGGEAKDKFLHFVAVNLERYPVVYPNFTEIQDFAMVKNWNHQWNMMRTVEKYRSNKFFAVLDAVSQAKQLGLLDWDERPSGMFRTDNEVW